MNLFNMKTFTIGCTLRKNWTEISIIRIRQIIAEGDAIDEY